MNGLLNKIIKVFHLIPINHLNHSIMRIKITAMKKWQISIYKYRIEIPNS